jgi:hypothetical protein
MALASGVKVLLLSGNIESDYNAGRIDVGIRLTQGGDDPIASSFRWAQVNKQYLVFRMLDDAAQRLATAHQVRRGELTFEDGILEVVSVSPHQFEYFP